MMIMVLVVMTKRWIKCSTFGKEKKRKAKPYGDQGKGINRDFVLALKTP